MIQPTSVIYDIKPYLIPDYSSFPKFKMVTPFTTLKLLIPTKLLP